VILLDVERTHVVLGYVVGVIPGSAGSASDRIEVFEFVDTITQRLV